MSSSGDSRWGLFAVLVILVGCRQEVPQATSAPAPNAALASSPVAALASSKEFSFEVPANWSQVSPDRDKTVVMLLLNGTAWHNSEAMLKVDVGYPAAPTIEELAQSIAGADGEVLSGEIDLDGERAVRVRTPSVDMTRPREVVVAGRGGQVYLIMASGCPEVDVAAAVDQVIRSWKWSHS